MIVLSKPRALDLILDLVLGKPVAVSLPPLCPICELREAACICGEGERRRFSRAYGEG